MNNTWVLKLAFVGKGFNKEVDNIDTLPTLQIKYGSYKELMDYAREMELSELETNAYVEYTIIPVEDHKDNLIKQKRLAENKRSQLIKETIDKLNQLKELYAI